jgi:hypothetical protein
VGASSGAAHTLEHTTHSSSSSSCSGNTHGRIHRGSDPILTLKHTAASSAASVPLPHTQGRRAPSPYTQRPCAARSASSRARELRPTSVGIMLARWRSSLCTAREVNGGMTLASSKLYAAGAALSGQALAARWWRPHSLWADAFCCGDSSGRSSKRAHLLRSQHRKEIKLPRSQAPRSPLERCGCDVVRVRSATAVLLQRSCATMRRTHCRAAMRMRSEINLREMTGDEAQPDRGWARWRRRVRRPYLACTIQASRYNSYGG